MQAMILAAGFGTRLLPFTKLRPKPLFPILNKPLLLLTIDRLKNCGFTKIIINCHHLADQIEEAVSPFNEVIVQKEETILGTGGGLRRAVDQMSDEPLLITNGDIYHLIPFLELYNQHKKSGSPITLGVHDYPRFNALKVENELGRPTEIIPAVGEPPISRWVYDDRVVYFERSSVIHVTWPVVFIERW